MMKIVKRPLSILLSVLMVVGLFTIVPITASAFEWYPYSLYISSVTELKEGDVIEGYLIIDEDDETYTSIDGDLVTVINADTSEQIIYRTDSEWTADKDYEIVKKEQVDLCDGYEDDYDDSSVYEYVFYVREPAPATYTVTWNNWDGTELEKDEDVAEGATPTYDGETPTKAPSNNYTYTFAGWNPVPSEVTGDATYTATFTPVTRSYTVTWKNGDEVLKTETVAYGETPAYTGETPTKAGDKQYTYTFAGWNPVPSEVTGDATYTATFTPVTRSYTVTWKNGDEVLKTETVAYGETPAYTGETPTKAGDKQYTYTFSGWSPKVTAVTGDVTYTAQFTPVQNEPAYIITIPATADINGGTVTIKAENVELHGGQAINLTVSGENTQKGETTFNAKNENGDSTVKYTIKNGVENIECGGTALSFTDNGSQSLTFTKTSDPTFAGKHTETLTFGITVENAAPANPYAANVVGDVVTFGSYNWYIIGKSDDGVTLLMKESFTNKAYNDSSTDITWENCTLRSYLNNDFYNTFSDEDKAKIALTHNENPNNPQHGTDGGNDTDDYIYLLSLDEAYALDESIRNISSNWLLRSPGYKSTLAAVVNKNNDVYPYGLNVNKNYGVRPALTLKF